MDDLVEISDLESYVKASQSVLAFLSYGYFDSISCQRELDAAIQSQRPMILLHESDPSRGGAPLATLRQECPERMREYVFLEREVQPSGFPSCSLRQPKLP